MPLAIALALFALPGPIGDDDSGPILSLLRKQADDWNRADLDAFMETYWKSPQLVFQSGGTRSEGWETVRDRYRKRYQGEGKAMGKLEFKGIEAESLGPDSAFARGRWELTMPDGTRPGGLFTLILRKKAEGWRIVHDHTSADTP
ncbi:MAG: DUF4440 domain-containing protein [Isosphaeraceae bacterium]